MIVARSLAGAGARGGQVCSWAMKWFDGNLYVSRSALWLMIAAGASAELGFIVAAMLVEHETISGLAFFGALMFPMLAIAVGGATRTEDLARVTQAGALGFCTACGSDQLYNLDPGIYECGECGYLGGPGDAQARAREQIEALQAELVGVSEDERRAMAIADLEQALEAFQVAGRELRTAASSISMRHVSSNQYSDGTGDDRVIPGLEQGSAYFVRGNALVEAAGAKLGASLGIPTDVDGNGPAADAVAAVQREDAVRAMLRHLRSR